MRNRFLPSLILLGVVALGCQREEEITVYKVPRVEPLPVTKTEPVRFLGAIFPTKPESWFVRVQGPVEVVTPLAETFQKFVESIKFTGKADDPVTWQLPEGWQKQPPQDDAKVQFKRFATFRIKDKPDDVEVVMAKATGGVLENVNRYRGIIGLPPLAKNDLADETKTIDVDGMKVTLLNMVGKRSTGGPAGAGPMQLPKLDINKEGSSKISFQLPAGWTEQKVSVPFAVKQFEAGPGVKVTITQVGGGVAQNINRWRGQAKLPELPAKDVEASAATLELSAGKAAYVDVENQKDARLPRTLGVIIPGGNMDWVIKMWGPSAVVGREKSSFEAFAISLRFEKK